MGYGDINGETNTERVVAIVAMVVGSFCFGLLVANLSSMITTGTMAEQEYTRRQVPPCRTPPP